MKLSIFRSHTHPSEAPVSLPPDGERPSRQRRFRLASGEKLEAMTELQQRILDRLAVVAAALGVFVFIADLPLLLKNDQRLTIIVAGMAFLGMVASAVVRSLPYALRAALLLLGLMSAGFVTLLGDGLFGSGRVFLISLPFIAVIFSSRRGRIAWVAATIGVVALTGAGMVLGLIPAPALRAGMGNTSLSSWIVATANFSLLTISGVASLGMLVSGLEHSLRQQKILSGQLEDERSDLELRVDARTHDLERRLVQLRTVAEITGAISRVLDIDDLLTEVAELIRERFNLYYVGVFLVEPGRSGDEAAHYAVLRAGTGDAGRELLAAGHRLAVGSDSMVGWACANKQARIALDVGADAVRFNNPSLSRTRSELALPITTRSASPDNEDESQPGDVRVLGVLTIQSTQESAFDQDDITALQGIADSLANAIENARLFSALSANLNEVRSLHRQYLEGAWSQAAGAGELQYEFTPRKIRRSDAAGPPRPEGDALEVPIRLRDSVIGSLYLEASADEDGQAWSAENRALVEAVANQAALALENARLLEETQRAAEIERRAAGISSKLWSTNDVEAIVRTTLRELGSALEAHDGSIELWPAGAVRREASNASD